MLVEIREYNKYRSYISDDFEVWIEAITSSEQTYEDSKLKNPENDIDFEMIKVALDTLKESDKTDGKFDDRNEFFKFSLSALRSGLGYGDIIPILKRSEGYNPKFDEVWFSKLPKEYGRKEGSNITPATFLDYAKKTDEELWKKKLAAFYGPLFNADRVKEGIRSGKQIFIVKTQTEAKFLATSGRVVTCAFVKTNLLITYFADYLVDSSAIILREKGKSGDKFAEQIEEAIKDVVTSLKDCVLPAKGSGKRVTNVTSYFAAGYSDQDLVDLIETTEYIKRPNEDDFSVFKKLEDGNELRYATDVKPTDYLVEGMLTKGGVKIVVGWLGSGKSTILLSLAIALVTESYFLGKYKCNTRTPVVFLHLEWTRSQIQEKLKKFVGKESDLSMLEIIACDTEIRENQYGFPPLQAGGWEALREIVRNHPGSVIIIDVIGKIFPDTPRGKTDYNFIYSLYAKFFDLSNQFDVTFIFAHHTTKQETDDPTKMAMGSAAYVAAAESRYFIAKKENIPYILCQSKGINQNVPIEFDPATKSFYALDESLEELIRNKDQKKKMTVERQEILDLLHGNLRELTVRDIVDKLGKNEKAIQSLLGKLKDQGILKVTMKSRPGLKGRTGYWSLETTNGSDSNDRSNGGDGSDGLKEYESVFDPF
jgi:hypothetical protein